MTQTNNAAVKINRIKNASGMVLAPPPRGAVDPGPEAKTQVLGSAVVDPTLVAELERLRAENASLKAQASQPGGMSIRVSEKGAVSVYGLGRFPVTLYKEQWLKLLARAEAIKSFLTEAEKEGKLSVKTVKTAEEKAALEAEIEQRKAQAQTKVGTPPTMRRAVHIPAR